MTLSEDACLGVMCYYESMDNIAHHCIEMALKAAGECEFIACKQIPTKPWLDPAMRVVIHFKTEVSLEEAKKFIPNMWGDEATWDLIS